jgi:hypothetical protein
MKVIQMPVYENCEVTTYTGEGSYRSNCDVNIHDGSIAVSYRDNGGIIVYEGNEIAPGHFNLTPAATNGRAALHLVLNQNVLESWRLEGRCEGMWRIELE